MPGLDYSSDAGEKKSTATETGSDKQEDKTSEELEGEAAAETSAIVKDQEETTETKKKEEPEQKETTEKKKDEEGDNLKKYYDENPDKKSLDSKFDQKVKEGDYEEADDGKIIIRAKHLYDDVKDMLDNPQKFFKIKKANLAKAKLFTKWMGVTRSDGSPDVDKMSSILNEFIIAETPEKSKKIVDENFPEWLGEGNLPFEFKEKEGGKGEENISKDVPYRYPELSDAIDSYIKSYTKTKVDGQPAITSEELWEDTRFFAELKKNKFDSSTGKLRSPSEIVKLSTENVYDLEKKETIVSQGGRKTTVKIEEKKTATTGKAKGPKSWY